ncbi:MAG TPA: LPS export ABC transporter periplasmic protein LptC [Bacillota bacterium]
MRKALTIPMAFLATGFVLAITLLSLHRLGWIDFTSLQSRPLSLLPLVQKEAPSDSGSSESKGEAHDTLRIEEAEISLIDEGNRLSWELFIENMTEDEDKQYYLLSRIHGKYFPLNGEAFHIQAKAGRMTRDFSQLELFGEVTISRSDLALTALEAFWSTEAAKITFKNKVRLQREDVRVEAEVMHSDPDLERIEIEGNSKWSLTDVTD